MKNKIKNKPKGGTTPTKVDQKRTNTNKAVTHYIKSYQGGASDYIDKKKLCSTALEMFPNLTGPPVYFKDTPTRYTEQMKMLEEEYVAMKKEHPQLTDAYDNAYKKLTADDDDCKHWTRNDQWAHEQLMERRRDHMRWRRNFTNGLNEIEKKVKMPISVTDTWTDMYAPGTNFKLVLPPGASPRTGTRL